MACPEPFEIYPDKEHSYSEQARDKDPFRHDVVADQIDCHLEQKFGRCLRGSKHLLMCERLRGGGCQEASAGTNRKKDAAEGHLSSHLNSSKSPTTLYNERTRSRRARTRTIILDKSLVALRLPLGPVILNKQPLDRKI